MTETDNLRRQKKTLFRKANRMSKQFNIDIHICLRERKKGKHQIYTSDGELPSALRELLATWHPIPVVLTPASFEDGEARESVIEAGEEEGLGR